jgi:nitric oxide reductase subunit C
MTTRQASIGTFVLLCAAYSLYSFSLYVQPESTLSHALNGNPSRGKTVWQNCNCQACHQFYGLGGYLGPDLTNVISKYNNNRLVIKSFIMSGNASMPAYQLPERDLDALVDFLGHMNASGAASPKSFKRLPFGMIE